ncbi:MAG: hypothetical protein JRC93_03985 [Deltaproteobacteria bacterium]|nr:hypothetical protein [Deltaproteobacteria bacterium]
MTQQNLWFFDTETFAHDWLFVAKRQSDGETITVWNDNESVQDFVELLNPILCGYNTSHYDQYILKAILLDWEPKDVKRVNDTIIHEDDRSLVWALFQGHPWVVLPPTIDLWPDIVPRKSLKEIEANIGMDIVESSVSFDIDRPLTVTERDEVTRYCKHDVAATEALYALRFDYLKAKSDLCELRDVDPNTMLQHTNARIVSEVLGATRLPSIPYEEYEIPDNVNQTAIPQEVLDFVLSVNTDNCMDNAEKIEFMFHDCPTVVGLGGIHAAVPSYKETADEDRVILHQDIGSFYPSLIINNGYMSRSVPDGGHYKQFYDLRMQAKADGDKATADAAKLVLNTTYGTMKDTYNKMYDPMQGTRVCLSGQLYILDLIELLFFASSYAPKTQPMGLQLIQLNTDGWIISCARKHVWRIYDAVAVWKRRTGFTVDTHEIEVIVQANVNNYVMRTTEGVVTTKGGVVTHHAGGDFKSNSRTIIDKAVVDYLLDDVPLENTILQCDDIERFQIVAKAGRMFQKVVHGYRVGVSEKEDPANILGFDAEAETQRCNRVYATTAKKYGGIFKLKIKDGEEVGRSKIPLTPEHCFVDNENKWKDIGIDLTTLDKSWYVALAKKKAKAFITRDKKEKDQMTETDEKTNELKDGKAAPKAKPKAKAKSKAAPKKLTFKEKLPQLQIAMANAAKGVTFDGVVSNISYEYADTQQYKTWLASICSELGLIFKLNTTSEFLGIITPESKNTPSYAVHATGWVTITDVESDEHEHYDISGLGVNVQAGYCEGVAQTNALRNFILNNYLLDNKGRDGDDVGMNADDIGKSGYVSGAEKAQIKQEISDKKADEKKYATDIYAKALYKKIVEAQKTKPKFGAKILKEHFETDGTPKMGKNGKSTIPKSTATLGYGKAEEIIAEGEADV